MAQLNPNAISISSNPRIDVIERGAPSYSLRNGSQEATREFLVVAANEGEEYARTEADALQALPIVRGAQHPRYPTMRAQDFEVRHVDDRPYSWTIIVTYRSGGDASEIPPGDVGYVDVDLEFTLQFRDAYRIAKPTNALLTPWNLITDLFIPPGGVPIYTAGFGVTDIAGVPYDEGGNPLSIEVLRGILTMSEVVDSEPDFASYNHNVGSRNLHEFEGAAIGQLLYAGARSNRTGETQWTITHTLVYDEFFHMHQACKFEKDVNQNWVPRLFVSDTDSPYFAHAEIVYWVQPHPRLTDFAAFLPDRSG